MHGDRAVQDLSNNVRPVLSIQKNKAKPVL